MSDVASHCERLARSTSDEMREAHRRSRSLRRHPYGGLPPSASEPRGASPPLSGAWSGGRLDAAEAVEIERRRGWRAARQRRRENVGVAAPPDADDEGVPAVAPVAGVLVSRDAGPAGELERDRARRGHDLELAARRDVLERSPDERLEPGSELERAGVDPVGIHR